MKTIYPRVSVIIPSYQNVQLLRRAIESVNHQTYQNIELIVVDDNPPDSPARRETETLMEDYPEAAYLCHDRNRGGSAARNTGIAHASGKYLAFLDNDDVYLSRHIEECVKKMEENSSCGCVLAGVMKIRNGLCWEKVPASAENMQKRLLFSGTSLGTGSNLFLTAEAVRELHGFDETFIRHQDLEFGVRLFGKYSACANSGITILKDMGSSSNTQDFQRSLATKRHFWRKFQYVIQALTPEERNRFYAGQYKALLYQACREGNQAARVWTEKKLSSYRPLNFQEKFLCQLSRARLFFIYEMLKSVGMRGKTRRNYAELVKLLNEEDRMLLDVMLRR